MQEQTEAPALESRSLLVLAASVTGTAIDVAERIGREGRRLGWSAVVKDVADFDKADLLKEQLIVFVLSTTGNGASPPSFTPLWTVLLHPRLPPDFLEDLRFAVYGLGDSSYGRYNWVGKKAFRRLQGLGAHSVAELGEGDDQNEWGIESTLPGWLEKLWRNIDPLYPAPVDFEPIAAFTLPAARSKLVPSSAVNSGPEHLLWARDARFAKVKANDRATHPDHWQDVRHLLLEFEGNLSYEPGDVLEIRPQNSEENVDNLLRDLRWTDFADTSYEICPTTTDQPLPAHLPVPYQTTLRHLLTYELDFDSVPRLSFFEWLAYFTEGDLQEKLRWFCCPQGQDDMFDYAVRPRRTIAEIIYEFRAAAVPPEYVFDLFPLMRPRGFSIASSSKMQPTEVQLLVAIVSYRTALSVPRKGVCTSYIARLATGDRLALRLERGIMSLPADPTAPIIMIGPGTGVAPFRSFVAERRLANASKNLLFFGCRSINKDFYYEGEWCKAEKSGFLTLSVAASRDQEDKIYVQQRMEQEAELVASYLKAGAYVYICGTSKNMPKAVKKAFVKVIAATRAAPEGSAQQYWDDMERAGRVVEETW